MPTFTGQISAQVPQVVKDHLGGVVEQDRDVFRGTSEADVIRLVLEVGLPLVDRIAPGARIDMYARIRRGLPAQYDVISGG